MADLKALLYPENVIGGIPGATRTLDFLFPFFYKIFLYEGNLLSVWCNS
jgi:hypothetical protein